MERLFAAVFGLVLIVISASGLALGVAGWAASAEHCPDGADCQDARTATILGFAVAGLCVLGLLILWRRSGGRPDG